MFPTFVTIALFIAPAIQGALADFAVNTPALAQCQDANISWEPTKGPYNLIVVNADDPCGDALVDMGDFNGTSTSWKVNLAAGKKVQLSLEDASGDEAWSGPITVAGGDDESCLAAVQNISTATASATSSSVQQSGTTLIVTPTTTVDPVPNDPSASPIGAAGNAGANPFSSSNGGLTLRQVNTPTMLISALAAIFVISF